jgi:phosphatidylserine decarboxylase
MTPTADTFIVSKAGYKYVAILVALVVVFSYLNLSLLRLISLVLLGIVIYVYRNPELEIPYMQKGAFLAPVDGKIIAINTLDDGYELVIKSSLLDVSILRTPFFSTVNSVKMRRGARLSTENRKALLLNEKVEITFEDRYNNSVKIEHMLENSIDDLTINLHDGIELSQGKRYGVMTKGKTIIHLPLTARLSVQVDSQVKSGETLLGYLS